MLTRDQYRKMTGRPPLQTEGAKSSGSPAASAPAKTTEPQRLHTSVLTDAQPPAEKKDPQTLVKEQYAEVTNSLIMLGATLAVFKSKLSDQDYIDLLADSEIKPAEAQSYINFTHKAGTEKPKARRAKKSNDREPVYGRI